MRSATVLLKLRTFLIAAGFHRSSISHGLTYPRAAQPHRGSLRIRLGPEFVEPLNDLVIAIFPIQGQRVAVMFVNKQRINFTVFL